MRTAVSTAKGIQDRLDAMTRSGSILNGDGAYGGIQPISAGEITFSKTVRISSAQTLIGQGPETRITWLGGPGTAAFEVWAYAGHGYVDSPCIRDLQVACPNGGQMIRVHESAKFIERLNVSNVITTGGVILPKENYACVLDAVRFNVKDQQALRLDGQCHVLRGVKVQGNVSASAAKITAVVELHGSATFEGFCWLEGNFACPTIAFCDWQGWPGEFTVGPTWEEAHVDGTFALVSNATVTTPMLGGTERWPWLLERGGTIRTQRQPHSPGTVVSPDGTGKLVINGAEQTVVK